MWNSQKYFNERLLMIIVPELVMYAAEVRGSVNNSKDGWFSECTNKMHTGFYKIFLVMHITVGHKQHYSIYSSFLGCGEGAGPVNAMCLHHHYLCLNS